MKDVNLSRDSNEDPREKLIRECKDKGNLIMIKQIWL